MEHYKRSALITGCTTGSIGHALALEFQKQGFYVIASSRNLDTMPDLKEHKLIETVQLDVCNAESIRAARLKIEEWTDGRLDILVNNAGGEDAGRPSIEFPIDRAQHTFDLNFFGPVRMVNEFIPLLLKSQSATIANISSGASVIPVPFTSMYNAAKAALNQWGDSLRIELAPFGINVVNVLTGAIQNSKDFEKDFKLDLKPYSLYRPVKDPYLAAIVKRTSGRTPTADFARVVVSEVSKKHPKQWVYAGKMSWVAWIILTFFPRFLIHIIIYKMSKFELLQGIKS